MPTTPYFTEYQQTLVTAYQEIRTAAKTIRANHTSKRAVPPPIQTVLDRLDSLADNLYATLRTRNPEAVDRHL